MQQERTESSNQSSQPNATASTQPPSTQHGSSERDQLEDDSRNVGGLASHVAATPRSASGHGLLRGAVNPGTLDERLRRLSRESPRTALNAASIPGRRIVEYENAALPASKARSPGLSPARSAASAEVEGVQLTDFPNEILTQVLSHLPAESHLAVALVSKRFYDIVTTPHAWRMAFHRFFPGTDTSAEAARRPVETVHSPRSVASSEPIRSETKYFGRLSPLASWRSEYLLRTRLLRSLAKGKPGVLPAGVSSPSARQKLHGKKPGAVLTYYSKLPWMVTNLHAVFANGQKPARVIHGAAGLGIGSLSDPASGKVEKWGLDDPVSFSQLDEVVPGLEPYGVGNGLAAGPNVVDVSQLYGLIGGEGFPGGRVFFRSVSEHRGRYLGQEPGPVDSAPDIPRVPIMFEAVCSLWIAKSSALPSLTGATLGIMTGSSLGVVTSYALRAEYSSVYANGDMTARWVLSPGVPIIALKVDNAYSARRKATGRVLAVALNALGEVYCLKQPPVPSTKRSKAADMVKDAWLAGRTVEWELVPATRRRVQPDADVPGQTATPLSSAAATPLPYAQLCARAREAEELMSYAPNHFRDLFEGWDMQRRLEVDFAGAEDAGMAEGIFVIGCGCDKTSPPTILRHSRQVSNEPLDDTQEVAEVDWTDEPHQHSPSEWQTTEFVLPGARTLEITSVACDQSQYATLAWHEDPLGGGEPPAKAGVATPTSKHRTGEIPGRRARLLAVGTDAGSIIAWNMRAAAASSEVYPVRIIQTQSPKVTALALSALYLVHGGSDGLAQAWDPLASTLEPVRILNARSSGRLPRQAVNAIPASRLAEYAAVGAIFLDPDPAVLRGVLAFGSLIRYWTYSSAAEPTGRKKRLRHSDVHGRMASRRQGGAVSSYIAAEEAEMRREQDTQDRERARLSSRFGLGLGLTEEEAVRYAEILSEEAYEDEQRRLSASDTASTPDAGDASSSSTDVISFATPTPEPSMSGVGSPVTRALQVSEEEDEFEQQTQRALRLSLLESDGHSSSPVGSGDYDFEFKYKPKKGRRSPSSSPVTAESSRSASRWQAGAAVSASRYEGPPSHAPTSAGTDADADLELALRLSLQEDQQFSRGKGKGKARDVV